ncbi:membrane protein [Paenibacillus sp. IHB B 3415]|uniref:TraX family protein n=1 Tax=Paenibacillus sp. IHB B 3415 TaxID=867080 RepID=UPI000573337C|nr:TraX family protein [Paenibacillus sp. IHB B 3415]KHL97111.1 membrane protein [Paenibacillus sp. IHB B 3415]
MQTANFTTVKFVNSNTLKIIAILSMFIDHLSVWLVPSGTPLDIFFHTIGRLAAPIMCYLIAEGFSHTSNLNKYMNRLFLFALLSHFPFVLFFGLSWWQGTSVIWDLLMGLIALSICQNSKLPLWSQVLAVAACCLLAWTADWNYIGVLWVVCFGILRKHLSLQMLGFALIGTVFYILPGLANSGINAIFRFGILLAIPLFLLYNGSRGRKSNVIKWGFYIFYPLHLVVLYLFRYVLFE